MKTFREFINEKVISNIAKKDIYENPSNSEFNSLVVDANGRYGEKTLRGFINKDGTLFLWNGSVLHSPVVDKLETKLKALMKTRYHYLKKVLVLLLI